MTQSEPVRPSRPSTPSTPSFRERHRAGRRREFLDVALSIVIADGLAGLTMQRVTDEVGCATGSIYQYFRTKGALVAALQREAIEIVGTAVLGQVAAADRLAADRRADAATVAMARIVAAAHCWVYAERWLPEQIELCRRMLTDPAEILTDDEAVDVVPAAVGLFDAMCELFSAAVAAGALRAGEEITRAIVLLGGTTGVQLTAVLARWDARLDDAAAPALAMVHDLLQAWSVDPAIVVRATELVDELAPVVVPTRAEG